MDVNGWSLMLMNISANDDPVKDRQKSVLRLVCGVTILYVHLYLQQRGLIHSNQRLLFWEINSFCHYACHPGSHDG